MFALTPGGEGAVVVRLRAVDTFDSRERPDQFDSGGHCNRAEMQAASKPLTASFSTTYQGSDPKITKGMVMTSLVLVDITNRL
jgi:hypothetical protein